jgi:hypothetical protein
MFVHHDFLSGLFAPMEKTRTNKLGMQPMASLQLEMSPSVWGTSVNGRVAGPALRAADKEAMHLIVLGVQQDRPTVAAKKINGVRACDENRWRIHRAFEARGFPYS